MDAILVSTTYIVAIIIALIAVIYYTYRYKKKHAAPSFTDLYFSDTSISNGTKYFKIINE